MTTLFSSPRDSGLLDIASLDPVGIFEGSGATENSEDYKGETALQLAIKHMEAEGSKKGVMYFFNLRFEHTVFINYIVCICRAEGYRLAE